MVVEEGGELGRHPRLGGRPKRARVGLSVIRYGGPFICPFYPSPLLRWKSKKFLTSLPKLPLESPLVYLLEGGPKLFPLLEAHPHPLPSLIPRVRGVDPCSSRGFQGFYHGVAGGVLGEILHKHCSVQVGDMDVGVFFGLWFLMVKVIERFSWVRGDYF